MSQELPYDQQENSYREQRPDAGHGVVFRKIYGDLDRHLCVFRTWGNLASTGDTQQTMAKCLYK